MDWITSLWSGNVGLNIFWNVLVLVFGCFILIKGADFFVSSSASIAKKLHVSASIIGLTIVSFGTSAPELAVSISGAFAAKASGATADISMGNVVGSNIVNLLVVLGISSVIIPIKVKKGVLKREYPFLILVTLMLIAFSFDVFLNGAVANVIARGEAIVLVLMLVLYLYMLFRSSKRDKETLDVEAEVSEYAKPVSNTRNIILLIVGLVGIVLGGEFVTSTATHLSTKAATSAGLDESLVTTLVGLTVVAIGTSLPELVTSIIAAKQGENEIAIGNVIGSNIFNTVFIVGLAGTITPLGINSAVLFDMLYMLLATVVVYIFIFRNHKLGRKAGISLLCIYGVYLAFIICRIFFPVLNFFN